jgi:hypothetical protein
MRRAPCRSAIPDIRRGASTGRCFIGILKPDAVEMLGYGRNWAMTAVGKSGIDGQRNCQILEGSR